MSLYHHVANKEALLDAMVDAAVMELGAEVGPGGGPEAERDWVAALRARILTARTVMLRHKWLPAVIETRTKLSPPLVAYYEGVLATLVAGGFSYDLAHHTLHALGARVLGFSQELFDPGKGGGDAADMSEAETAAMAAAFPHLGAMMADIVHEGGETSIGWCDDQTEFEFGLDVLLDGLERRRAGATTGAPSTG
jgi:AcrR family transcriptional regulator